jgi:diacylglycerol O-acyltransferase / wax synthase
MQQLSNMDTSFLSLESQRTPMHIGCIWTFSAPKTGKMTFPRFKRHVVSRLPISPVFRRRLSSLPMNIDLPYWVEDRNFDIDNHLQHTQLHGKDAEEQKKTLSNHFFSQTLDQSKPLWAMIFIDCSNDESGEFSVLLKFHHAAADGKSAEKILSGLLSDSSEAVEPIEDTWEPETLSITRMAGNKLRSLYHAPKELSALTQSLKHSLVNSVQLRYRDKQEQPPHFFMSPHSPFNEQIEPARHMSSAHLSLSTIKEIKKAYAGSTVNDVVLTICAGALRKHLLKQGQLPVSPMVAMVPVSKREGDEQDQGNLVSPMLVSLATNVGSPLARLETVHQNALKAKEYNREVAIEKIINHLPSWSSAWVTKAYTHFRVAKRINPVFNLIITNVPGPTNPLYLDGAELTSMEGMAPIVDGMGLTLVVTSYIDTLTIAVTSTSDMAAHAPFFLKYLHESLEELQQAVLPGKSKTPSKSQATA